MTATEPSKVTRGYLLCHRSKTCRLCNVLLVKNTIS